MKGVTKMGLLDGFKKKEMVVTSPLKGQSVSLKEVPDETFSQGFLGNGAAIEPAEGKVYAPVDGEITTAFPTGHAIGLKSKQGLEVLIHVGIDTVMLEGKYFQLKVKEGQQVRQGDLLIEVDIQAVKAEGYKVITPVIICNTAEYQSVEGIVGKEVQPGDTLIQVKK
jgi:PTS system beta-glucosides-specific IIC component